jgi:hypothetical protein
MSIAIERPELLSADLPTLVVALLVVIATLIWVGSHHFRKQWQLGRVPAIVFFVVRSGIGYVTLWLTCSLFVRWIVFATSWSLWGVCLGTAVGVEVILALYQLERQTVTQKTGLTLVCLRTAMLLLVVLMLLQPVIVWEQEHVDERVVAILVDDSTSMDIQDDQLTDSEQIRLAHMFNPNLAKRPYDLDGVVSQLGRTINGINVEAASLVRLQNSDQQNLGKAFQVRREPLRQTVQQWRTTLAEQESRFRDLLGADLKLAEETRAKASALRDRIDNNAISRLVDCQKAVIATGQDAVTRVGAVVEHLQGVATELRAINQELMTLVETVDRTFLQSLSPEDSKEVTEVASRSRAQIARAMLLRSQGDEKNLLGKFRDGYTVKVFGFDSQLTETTEEQLKAELALADSEETGSDDGATTNSVPDDQQQQQTAETAVQQNRLTTDVVAALERVREEIAQEKLAGILLVSDGRHNAAGDLGTVARELANRQVPVSAVVVGSSRAPVDAAIVGLESPSTLFVEDQLRVRARVKINGMKNRDVWVVMSHGDEKPIEQKIEVKEDEFSGVVELYDVPKIEGFQRYSVRIETRDGDAGPKDTFANNNSRDVTVAVTDERTQVLIIEDRPRWEFRYLRNLLVGRDKTVRLQTVLLEPDRLATVKERPDIPASVTRSDGEHEATSLPANEQEWMKFDVIVLGDVSVDQLTTDGIRIIHNFVNKRGGTLIVIAGPRHVPHQFADTALQALFPVTFEPTAETMVASPEPSFRWILSQAGRRHAVTRQAETPEENDRIWSELPDLYWRYPITGTKPGATVLAYASNEQIEAELLAPAEESGEEAAARRKKRETQERQNALLATHSYGAGRVMMITSDRTWRLRYRVGDTYHHRFWGQIMRWAESGKLQAGTSKVRLGTDRILYGHGETISVKAKITDSELEPVLDDKAQIKVYQDQKLVLTKSLEAVPDSAGMYQLELNQLPGAGTFRLVLESPQATEVLASDGEEAVETSITVLSPQLNSKELLEPTADRETLAYLTHLSGGGVVEADQAAAVLDFFGTGTRRYTEQTRQTLWDAWPLLAVMVLLLTVEWVIRKRGGLI